MSEVATRDTRTPYQVLVGSIRSEEFQGQVALALPEGQSPRRFVRCAVTALLANPDIAKLDHDSVYASLLKCAQDGLVPDGREAAIVGYKEKAQYLPMISGVRKIAADSDWSVSTVVVYANDEFEHTLGTDEQIRHVPAPLGSDRGEMVAAYAVGKHPRHPRMIEVMNAADIAKARNVSRAKERGPWKDWPERMWEKTVGHRLVKKLPLNPEANVRMGRALAQIDAIESAEPGSAAAAIYGLPAATPDQEPADVGASPDGQQEDAAAGSAAAVASSPDDEPIIDADEDPEPTFDDEDESGFQPPAAALEAAAEKALELVIPTSHFKGQTIAAVLGAGTTDARRKKIDDWVTWALRQPADHWATDQDGDGMEFWRGLQAVAAAKLPELWNSHVEASAA